MTVRAPARHVLPDEWELLGPRSEEGQRVMLALVRAAAQVAAWAPPIGPDDNREGMFAVPVQVLYELRAAIADLIAFGGKT